MSAINRSGIHMIQQLILSFRLVGRNSGGWQHAASAIKVKAERGFQLHTFIVDAICLEISTAGVNALLRTYCDCRAK